MKDSNFRASFHKYFEVIPASTPRLKDDVFRIRYQVYCEELGYESEDQFPDRKEHDEYDHRSRHVLLRHRASGRQAGCVRLVFPANGQPLPLERIFMARQGTETHPVLPPEQPVGEVSRLAVPSAFRCGGQEDLEALSGNEYGEISRLAVTRPFRQRSDDAPEGVAKSTYPGSRGCPGTTEDRRQSYYIPVGLYLAAAAIAVHAGIHHVFVMAEPRLIRHLRYYGIYFNQVTEPIEHRGQRCVYHISRERLHDNLPPDLSQLLDDFLGDFTQIKGWDRPASVA